MILSKTSLFAIFGATAACMLAAGACTVEEARDVDDDAATDATSSSSGQTSSSATGGGGSAATVGSGGSIMVPGGPSVMSFAANETVLYVYDTATFTAQVDDPDGPSDIVGGVLKGPTGITYGDFLKSGGGNAYAISVNWDDMNLIDPVAFPNGGTTRVFTAEFTDTAGNVGSSNITLSIECQGGEGFCGEYCTNTDSDFENCGACGTSCFCGGGMCVACEPAPATVPFTCDDVCAAKGQVCNRDSCGEAGMGYENATCTGTPVDSTFSCSSTFFTPTLTHVQCCCE